jgi:hypothetical protein
MNALAAFITELLGPSPHPPLGPNDPPEWRRERLREQLTDQSFRLLTGKSRGEVTGLDMFATMLSYLIPAGRFAPVGSATLRGTTAAAAQAAKAGDASAILRHLTELLRYTAPTYAPMTWSEVLRYGRFPVRRVGQAEHVVGSIVDSASGASEVPAPLPWPGIPMP